MVVGVRTRREGVKLLMDAAGLELPPDEEEEPSPGSRAFVVANCVASASLPKNRCDVP